MARVGRAGLNFALAGGVRLPVLRTQGLLLVIERGRGGMEKVFVWLRPFVRFLVAHPAVVFALGLVLAGLGAWQAANLRVDSDFSKLIPQHYTSVQALERLRAAVGGESEAAVVIESPSFEA